MALGAMMEHWLSRNRCHPKVKQHFTVGGNEYVLGGKIGDGAAGLVRKATQLANDSTVAVKFLAPDPKYIEQSVFDDVATRFKREGERGAALEHPHLIDVWSYCENTDGELFAAKQPKNPFLLMEYMRGKTLESYINNCPSEAAGVFTVTREKLHIALQIADALQHLQKSRLIHRDVKPANIYLLKDPSDRKYPLVKLGDFGVMKWGDYHASLSTGALTATHHRGLGTLKYMSPEQAVAPRDVTVRSDIFSLGITLFELFSARILPSPHHIFEVMNARLTRGTTLSRFLGMGYGLDPQDENVGELLLNMFLRGARNRPTIEKVWGTLDWEYERRYDSDWRYDTYRG